MERKDVTEGVNNIRTGLETIGMKMGMIEGEEGTRDRYHGRRKHYGQIQVSPDSHRRQDANAMNQDKKGTV